MVRTRVSAGASRWAVMLATAALYGSCTELVPPAESAPEQAQSDGATASQPDASLARDGADAAIDSSSRQSDATSPQVLTDGKSPEMSDGSPDASADGPSNNPREADASRVADAARAPDASPGSSCAAGRGADVIWVVDSSGSTLFAQSAITANTDALLTLATSAPDSRFVVMAQPSTADAGAQPTRGPNVLSLAGPADSKAMFSLLLMRHAEYARHLRAGVPIHIVVVSDDNDLLMPTEFSAQMERLLGRPFVFHAVASPSVNGSPCIGEEQMVMNPLCVSPLPAICAAAAIGTHYYDLASTTGGERISICKRDWSPLLARLRRAVDACP